MRVLELLVSTALGGGPTHVLGLATRLDASHFTPLVAAPPDGVFFERFRRAGIETHDLPLNALSPRTLARVWALARRRRVDLIHSHGKGAGLYGRLAARLLGIPAVHTFHGLHHLGYGPLARRAYLALERALSRRTRTVVNVSAAQEDEGLRLGLFTRAQSVVIANGIDVAAVDDVVARRGLGRAEQELEAGALVIGCVARFDRVKALDVLLDAVRRARALIPSLRCVLVGAGPEAARLRGRAAALGVQGAVSFAGPVEDAFRLFPAWDLYVSASRVEGSPLTVLEAMACRRAVLATDIPGHRAAVEHGVTGMLTPPDDAAALAAAVGALLAAPDRRRLMGAAGRQRIETSFGIGAMVARIEEVYRRAIVA